MLYKRENCSWQPIKLKKKSVFVQLEFANMKPPEGLVVFQRLKILSEIITSIMIGSFGSDSNVTSHQCNYILHVWTRLKQQ